MFQLIANVLAWFYNLVPNYAIAIALLTITIMVLLTPLTLKSTKSMLEMQRLQPEMRRLQAQHKGDRQKLNEEMMKLYKEHSINPIGGCLPLLLQAPVFIILFRVLRSLTQVCHQPTTASRCLKVPNGNFGASYVSHTSRLWQDLASGSTMKSFGIDLADSAVKVISDSFVRGLPYLGLVLLVAATSYYQQRQVTTRATNQPANPQQQMLLKVMPGLFAVIALTFPAGLIVYFLTSNLYRIGQNAYITRRFYRGDHTATAGGSAPTKPTGTAKAKPIPSKTDGTKSAARPQPRPNPRAVTPPASKGSPVRGPAARPPARPNPRPTPRPAPKKKK